MLKKIPVGKLAASKSIIEIKSQFKNVWVVNVCWIPNSDLFIQCFQCSFAFCILFTLWNLHLKPRILETHTQITFSVKKCQVLTLSKIKFKSDAWNELCLATQSLLLVFIHAHSPFFRYRKDNIYIICDCSAVHGANSAWNKPWNESLWIIAALWWIQS